MIENFNAIVKPKSYLKSRLMTHTQIWKWNEKIQRCVHKSNDTHASNRSRFLVKWIAIVNVWYNLARVPTLFQLCRLWLCHCVHGRSFSVVPPPFILLLSVIASLTKWKRKKKGCDLLFKSPGRRLPLIFRCTMKSFILEPSFFFFFQYDDDYVHLSIHSAHRFFMAKKTMCCFATWRVLCPHGRGRLSTHSFDIQLCVHVFLLTPKSWQVKC